jgi:hypothetical protein
MNIKIRPALKREREGLFCWLSRARIKIGRTEKQIFHITVTKRRGEVEKENYDGADKINTHQRNKMFF